MLPRLVRRVALAAIAAPLAAGAQPSGDSLAAQIDRIFEPFTAPGSPGCLVGLSLAGKPAYVKGFGLANLEYDVPLTAQSISESGSVAKQFTSAALALLHVEGKLSLDDDVRRYLPELPDFGQRITIRHLLTHTSGLRDQWALLGLMGRGPGSEVHTMAEILDLATRQRELNFPVGSEYLYSNTGYALAAMIVERVSGMPFARFSEERLFKPLGMAHTQWRDDYRRVVRGRATAYDRAADGWVQDMPFTMVHGNGGLLSTMGDLLKWNQALTDGLLGRPELTRLLETQARLTGGRTISYALGLTVEPYRPGVREVSHGGSTAGYRTWLARYPEANASIAVFCNVAVANPTSLGRRVMALVLPRPAAARQAPTPVASAERDRLVGAYRDPRTDDWISIVAAGDFLRVVGPGADSLRGVEGGRYTTNQGVTLAFSPAGARATSLRLVTPDGDVRELQSAPPVEAGSVRLGDFAGTYRSPELGSAMVLRVDGGRLLARISPDLETPLVPVYTDGFRATQAGMTLRFGRGADGRVSGVRIFAGRARNVRFDRAP